MKRDIIRFQEELLIPTLGETPRLLLFQPSWMGFKGPGASWADLSDEDADALAAWMGPSAYKAVRFSPDIVSTIRRGRPTVVAGGSCLITSADNRRLKGDGAIEALIPRLPSLPQVVDPLMPILGASLHLNLLEDTLFAENREHLMGALQAEGCRHTTAFSTFARLHGAHAPVEPCFFSRLPVTHATREFYERPFFRNQVRPDLSRAQVAFSFTGPWADMLRQTRAIPEACDYLVVEPFHHFIETMRVQTGLPGSPVHRMLTWTQRFFEAYAYGEGENAGVAGGIAFLPYVEPDGRLGWDSTASEGTCHQGNALDFLAARRARLEVERIPALSSDALFADGLNCLYHVPACREALYAIRAVWNEIARACEPVQADKDVFVERRNALRLSHEIRRAWLPPHEVLYEQLERVVMSVFNPVTSVSRLAS
ncbi:hypothetical protein HY631_02360 [Candidatus Uhrbacteria bacterium]|nr:hypothetical protein [Candidatus Uhrbacteria bacterium]